MPREVRTLQLWIGTIKEREAPTEERKKGSDANPGEVKRRLCDREMVMLRPAGSKLSADFAKLAKPAQRALLNNGIYTPADLVKRTQKEVAALHGIGPSALPILGQALGKHRLCFKATC